MGHAIDTLEERLAAASQGGGERAVERHRSRGKMTARERLMALADEGSEPLELSTLAAAGRYSGDIASAGVITALATVCGRTCVVVSNDATVKGGTYYPLTLAKHLRAQEIAEENHLPSLYLVDSGGAHLPLQSEAFADRDHGGRIFYNQARMSAKGIAQVACVMGSCTAGGAYMPAMSSETAIVEGTGTVFLGGPPLVAAATGEIVSAEELGGARVHTQLSGLADYRAADDADGIRWMRSALDAAAPAPGPASRPWVRAEPVAATVSGADLDALVSAACDAGTSPMPADVAGWLVDAGRLDQFKQEHGPALLCAFAHLDGWPVGILAPTAALDGAASRKGAHFLRLCAEREIPAIVIHDAHDAAAEHPAAVRHLGQLVSALASSGTPLITLVTGAVAFPESHALALRELGPRFVFSWPSATWLGQDVYGATADLADDGLLMPSRTRHALSYALAAVASAPTDTRTLPIIRM